MKKTITLLLVCAMLCACSLACAAGVTVRTFTPFADMDFAAQGYMDLITAWEEETGNFAADYSGAMDELWMDQLRSMAASGEADLVILPAGSGLTHAQLLTVAELSALAPQLGVKVFPSMAEPDGSVLLSPLRLNWEALYVNTDVLAAHSLSLPASLEELTMVCSVLSAKGVLPIANAIGDWAEIALDCAALCGAPQAAYGSKASFDGAKDVMTMLAAVGAFGSDPLSMTDDEAMELFLSGAAAMRFDSDFLTYDMPSERAAVATVINPPARGGEATGLVVGTPGFGVAITRSCAADPARFEAAVSLCRALLDSDALLCPAGGMLGAGVAQLTRGARDCTGLLYDADPDGFDAWSAQVVSAFAK